MFFHSVQAVLNIFILMGLGAFLTRREWITPKSRPLLIKLVVNLAVPCTIFGNMLSAVTPGSFGTMVYTLLVPAITVSGMYFAGWIAGKYVLHMRQNRQRTYAAMAGCPNSIFVGLPIVMALFGDAGIPAAMFFFICQTTLFWSIGNAGILADAQGKSAFSLAAMLKRVFSVNVIVIIAVFLMVNFNIKAPAMLTSITAYIGGLSTPLSLLFSGNALYEIYCEFGVRGLKIKRDEWAVIAARFLFSPLLTLGLCSVFGIAGLTRMVFILMSSMPTMTQTVILSSAYGADRDFAALSFFWTTVITVLIIPLYMAILV